MSLYDGISRCGGRRFVMTIGAGLVNTLLLMCGYIGEQSYVTLTIATVAAYIGANTVQKYNEVKNAGTSA